MTIYMLSLRSKYLRQLPSLYRLRRTSFLSLSLSLLVSFNRQQIPVDANMAPVVSGEEYNSLNSSHNSATGGLGGLPGGAPGSAGGGGGGGGNRSNTLLFDTTKNELYRVTENLKTLQRKLKASDVKKIFVIAKNMQKKHFLGCMNSHRRRSRSRSLRKKVRGFNLRTLKV